MFGVRMELQQDVARQLSVDQVERAEVQVPLAESVFLVCKIQVPLGVVNVHVDTAVLLNIRIRRTYDRYMWEYAYRRITTHFKN